MRKLFEGLEKNDLQRLVHNEVHVDEFKSKLGADEDICVISFKVKHKDPALDLISFIEKGYEWALDADISSGEMDDGSYVVFVECERDTDIPENLMALMKDLVHVTGHKLKDWRLRYKGGIKDYQLEPQTLARIIPLKPEAYIKKFGSSESEKEDAEIENELDKLKAASGVKVTNNKKKSKMAEELQRAAGII